MQYICTTSHHPGTFAAASSSSVSTPCRDGARQACMAAWYRTLQGKPPDRAVKYLQVIQLSTSEVDCSPFPAQIPCPDSARDLALHPEAFDMHIQQHGSESRTTLGLKLSTMWSLSSVNANYRASAQRIRFRVDISLSTCRSIYRSVRGDARMGYKPAWWIATV